MAKKSAKSKGYRKSAAKKNYLSKKEITITAIVAAVVVIGFALFIGLYDDGALKLSGGALQTEGTNSLIVNSGTGYNPRYHKIGQLAEIDGYTLTSAPMGADENIPEYVYTPAGESPIDSIVINTYCLDAAGYAANAEKTYTTDPEMRSEGLMTTEDDGHTVHYLTFSHHPSDTETLPDDILTEALADILKDAQTDEASPEEQELLDMLAAAEEESEPMLVQALHGYVDAGENRMVYMLIRNDVESVDEYVDDAVLVEAMNQVLAALSYETK